MKRKVLVLSHHKKAKVLIKEDGDCYDLVACSSCKVTPDKVHLVSLGVSMKLPSGCYARVYDRSSTPLKKGYLLANSIGVIDHSYGGNKDVWKYAALAVSHKEDNVVTIKEGDIICQFEICLSQKATVWDKLKWLFTSGYEFEYVDDLGNENRGGFGTTEAKLKKEKK